MKEMILKIQFDDDGCYKGHGDNTPKLIKEGLEQYLKIDLQGDGVIKSWKVELINSLTDCVTDTSCG